jgi:hypothetical protein
MVASGAFINPGQLSRVFRQEAMPDDLPALHGTFESCGAAYGAGLG